MKLIIDEEKIIDLLETEWGYEGIREEVSKLLRENGTPYNPTGDLINRSELREEFKKSCHAAETLEELSNAVEDLIDNSPAIDISGNEYFPYRTAYFNGVADGRAMARPQVEEETT